MGEVEGAKHQGGENESELFFLKFFVDLKPGKKGRSRNGLTAKALASPEAMIPFALNTARLVWASTLVSKMI